MTVQCPKLASHSNRHRNVPKLRDGDSKDKNFSSFRRPVIFPSVGDTTLKTFAFMEFRVFPRLHEQKRKSHLPSQKINSRKNQQKIATEKKKKRREAILEFWLYPYSNSR